MKNRLLNLFSANKSRGIFNAAADDNTIELYDVIVSSDAEASWYGGVSLAAFSAALGGMSGDVHLRINSPGGDVFAGIAMAQLIREYKGGHVIAHVDGYAASAASIVAIAGSKTIMAPSSMMMIHKAWTFALGNSDDLSETADLLKKIDGQIAATYAEKSGGKASDFLAMMAKETWLTPDEAKDAGLSDETAESPAKVSASASATIWDLSAFDNAPRATAGRPTKIEPDPMAAASKKRRANQLALVTAV